jgi:energy-coupling factor transport system ATP-binding protein
MSLDPPGPLEPVLRTSGLTYRYPGAALPALRGVDLEIGPGCLVLLAGPSGSGKSTLLRAACGLVPHFHGGEVAGEVVVAGRSVREQGPAELATAVGFVAQEPETQVVSTTVGAELELPLHLRGAREVERARAVSEAALALGIEAILERTTDSLSGGELQRVAIGAALMTRPPLLLLDEPTSQLDPVAGEELIALLRRLNEEWGVSVLLGEHRIERCLGAADRVIAMDAGAVVFDGAPGEIDGEVLERAPVLATPAARLFSLAGLSGLPGTVREARLALAESGLAPSDRGAPADEPVGGRGQRAGAGEHAGPGAGIDTGSTALAARRLAVDLEAPGGSRAVLREIDLEIGAGELVALMGPNGAGKSTLLRACAGVVRPSTGRIDAPGGCALLSQRPDDYLVRESVAEELPGQDGAAALAAVGLDPGLEADPRDLSGGERQRLALAIAMAGRGAGGEPPGLVCLDEPTRGLDRLRKRDLAGFLRALAGRGAAVLVATHDAELAASLADRVVLLARGRVLADGRAAEVLAGGWYFSTNTARITRGAAITPEAGAEVIAARLAGTAGRAGS